MVRGDAHLVVVDHHDEVGAERGAIVETFECLAAAQRSVAYHRYHVLMSTL